MNSAGISFRLSPFRFPSFFIASSTSQVNIVVPHHLLQFHRLYQSGPPGQSMWPLTMAGQKKFFFKSIYLAICIVYNTRVVFSIL